MGLGDVYKRQVLFHGSKMAWFLAWGSKLTCFCVRAENDFFLVWGSIDLVLCGWSKLTWFSNAGQKSLGYSVSIELDFVFVGGRN